MRKHFSTPLDGVDEAPSLPQLRVYDLGLYRAQMRRKSEGLTFFSYMNLSRGFLAPQLTDYLIGNAIERLLERGELVKLPRPKIGGSYSWIGGRPAPAEGFAIAHNENRGKARARQAEAELERMCVEYHYWDLGGGRCKKRYTFEHSEQVDGNSTRHYITPVLKDQTSNCESCWEQSLPTGM